VKATEMRDELDNLINEFGDMELYRADELQPEWRIKIGGVLYDPDKESVLVQDEEDS
jgi:hypothetical protein